MEANAIESATERSKWYASTKKRTFQIKQILSSVLISNFIFFIHLFRAASAINKNFFDVDIFETLASRQKIKLTLDPRRKKFSYKQEAEKVIPLVSI